MNHLLHQEILSERFRVVAIHGLFVALCIVWALEEKDIPSIYLLLILHLEAINELTEIRRLRHCNAVRTLAILLA